MDELDIKMPLPEQMPKRPPEKSPFDEIEVEIECSEGKIEYAGCGTHKIHLHINVERRDLIEFLDKYDKERLTEDAGNGS